MISYEQAHSADAGHGLMYQKVTKHLSLRDSLCRNEVFHRPALFVCQILAQKQSRCSQQGKIALCSHYHMEKTMNSGIRIKSLNGNTFTETVVKDGKTFINVYDEDGNLIDVMEEVASYIPSRDDDKNEK